MPEENRHLYLSAFPPDLFEKLAQDKPVWAPFYTYHKIMAGLLDMYLYTGNTDALQIAEGMAQWAQDFMSGFSDAQRQRMLRTEYGGMNEVLVNLAATTKKERYLGRRPALRAAKFSRSAGRAARRIAGPAREYERPQDHRRGPYV